MTPRFSVLLPTHDRADVVGFAIRSVLVQTDPDFELLVAGDGCTDDTAAVVLGFDDRRIRWYDLPKAPGFGYANRNTVLSEARGELVAFMAHDDLLLPDHLEYLGEVFLDASVEWAYSRPVWVSDEGLLVPFGVDLRRADDYQRFMTTSNAIPASCIVHRRSCYRDHGGWDETVPHSADWDLWQRMLGPAGGANLAYVPDATVLHFRADWRPGRAWGPAPLDAWLWAAEADDSWPESLRHAVTAGEPAQAAFWRLIETDPTGWRSRMRDGIDAVMSSLAWSSALELSRLEVEMPGLLLAIARAGPHAEALALAEHGLRLFPGSAAMHGARGIVLLESGENADAETSLRRGIELDPSLPYLHGQLGLACARLGRPAEAITAMRLGIEVDHDAAFRTENAWLHAELGALLLEQGDLHGAEASLIDALRLDAGDAAAAEALFEVRRLLRQEPMPR